MSKFEFIRIVGRVFVGNARGVGLISGGGGVVGVVVGVVVVVML